MAKAFRYFLQVIGAITVTAIIALVLFILLARPGFEKINAATNEDVVFILNWGGISPDQNYSVLGSYQSARNLTGDHVDAYCVQLTQFAPSSPAAEQWRAREELNPVVQAALDLAANAAHQNLACFPDADTGLSAKVRAHVWSVDLHGERPTAAKIILFEPTLKRLYYVSFAT